MNKIKQLIDENENLKRRIDEIERVLDQMGPPYRQSEDVMPCMFDSINPTTNPVMGLACPCPRCSPRC